jgi:hypothetical protein
LNGFFVVEDGFYDNFVSFITNFFIVTFMAFMAVVFVSTPTTGHVGLAIRRTAAPYDQVVAFPAGDRRCSMAVFANVKEGLALVVAEE